jgi:hypothetical protein
MADPPTVSTQQAMANPGDSATLRAAGDPDIPPPKADPNRRVQPDATGLYEAEPPDPSSNSSCILQLNQAGCALVGWLTRPPRFVNDVPDPPVGAAVLVADLSPGAQTSQGVQFFYKTVDTIEGSDPDKVLAPYTPFDRNAPDDDILLGMIKIEPSSDSWGYLTQRVHVTLTFFAPDGSPVAPPLGFTQKSPAARPAERTINFQDESLKRTLIVRHRAPVPSSFFDISKGSGRVWRSARALFETESTGPLAAQIRLYQADADTSGPDGMARRELATGEIARLMTFAWDGYPQAKLLNMLLTRDAVQNTLTIDSKTKTYRDWLSGIAANETINQIIFDQGMAKVMGGARMYRYDLSLSTLSTDKQVVPFVKGAAGVFSVTVSAFSYAFTTDGQVPTDDKFVSAGKPSSYYGAFFELKAGEGGPPKLPDKVSFYSADEINPGDFDGVFFDLCALDAGASASASMSNPVMTLNASFGSSGNTQLVRLHIRGNVLDGPCATGSVVPKLTFGKKFKKPDWDTLKRIFSSRGLAQDSDFFSVSASTSVSLGASLGLGYIGSQQKFAKWMSPEGRVGSGWTEGGDARTLNACFDRDCADFTTKQIQGWDVRFLLETVLATDLALFNGVPSVDVEGFASPEGTPAHNLILSKKRAAAVLQVIKDAVGPLSDDATSADGRGDASAVDPKEGNLDEPDPTGDQDQLQAFEQAHTDQVSMWPQWRKVEINIRGHFYVHVITVDGDSA